MKKQLRGFFALIIAAMMALSLVACGGSDPNQPWFDWVDEYEPQIEAAIETFQTNFYANEGNPSMQLAAAETFLNFLFCVEESLLEIDAGALDAGNRQQFDYQLQTILEEIENISFLRDFLE